MQKRDKTKGISKYQVKIKKDKCKGCGLCIAYCPTKHLSFSKGFNKKGRKYAQANKRNKCLGCGACFFVCPDTAIEIYGKK